MAENLALLVDASRLITEFYLPNFVVHHVEPENEVWDLREQIGDGRSSVVRREERRVPRVGDISQSPTVRAVKQMRKIPQNQQGGLWNYRAELEAVVKFSQSEYEPFFVRTLGWFENQESVFLAMEFLPLGDLEQFKRSSPPFSEFNTSLVVWQLIQGVRHMHENGFAHRDLKPGNVLIASVSPVWHVKIADFGISKQAMEGVTRLHTMRIFGTWGYMAPEVLGYHRDTGSANNTTIAYTMSVDIWAIGVIAMSLLVKREVFHLPGDMASYVWGRQNLDFFRDQEEQLTDDCREFITALLAPDPVLRPTAVAALAHQWLEQAVEATQPSPAEATPVVEIPDSEADSDWGSEISTIPGSPAPSARYPHIKPNTKPSKESKTYSDALLTKFKYLRLDSVLLSPKFQTLVFDRVYIETSAAHSVWTSSQRVNKILDKGFRASEGHVVVLFFSVIASRKFCGIAQMTSTLDWGNTDPHWLEDVWQGRFTLTWLSHTELSFDLVKHVPVKETTPGFRAVACYDGTEISPGSAFELLRVYSAEERRRL
ncbi:kinase-like domain-containing protein [Apiosordaria backusii]|uniref:Kinase-like domain-containing protein n=1 Tax=Apiosordaria backusii TaxID=314023 RepID=A0AA40DXA8_9PEZI|nr:kinase-like domain-containing protein [Apiosordaria backusii]